MTYVIDPEGEYIVGPGRTVFTGQVLIEAISRFNLEHSKACPSMSPRPETPGFFCVMDKVHPLPHEAEGILRWWDTDEGMASPYEWLDPERKARWLARVRERVTEVGVTFRDAIDGVGSDHDS